MSAVLGRLVNGPGNAAELAPDPAESFLAALAGNFRAFRSVEFLQAFQGGVAGQEMPGRGDGDKGFEPDGIAFIHQQ